MPIYKSLLLKYCENYLRKLTLIYEIISATEY